MKNLDLAEIAEVRIGKHIELQIDAESEELAREKVTAACEKLLSNPIVESFEFELKAI
jgi:phosphoribosylformylglycinamidine synthase